MNTLDITPEEFPVAKSSPEIEEMIRSHTKKPFDAQKISSILAVVFVTTVILVLLWLLWTYMTTKPFLADTSGNTYQPQRLASVAKSTPLPTPAPTETSDPFSNWKKYSHKTLGFNIEQPKNFKLLNENDTSVEFSITAVDYDTEFVFLTITNHNTINQKAFTLCSKIINNPNSPDPASKPCIEDRWSEQVQTTDNVQVGGKPAKHFYFSAGGPDNDFHIVQLDDGSLEFKMYVSGGGLDNIFQQIVTSLKFQ